MPTLAVNPTHHIFYQEDDFTDPWENKPTIILQHGNGRNSGFWYRWIPFLSGHFRVIRPDMRGVGKSSKFPVSQITIEACLEDLVKIITTTCSGPVYFCGESMGGILGIILAAEYPKLIQSLTLIATPVYINDSMKEKYALGYSSRLEAMKSMGIKEWVRQTSIMTRFPPDTDPQLMNWYVDEFAKGNPETLIRYSELVSNADALQFLSKISCPTLAIFPHHGQITDADQERLLQEHIPNIRLSHIPSEYHMIHLTHVAACAKLALEHFNTT